MTTTSDSAGTEPRAQVFQAAGATFRRYQRGGCTVIEAAGEIDVAASPLLRSVLAEAPTPRLVIDLGRVTFLDSTGIGELVAAWKHAPSAGGALRLVRPHGSPLKVLQLTGVDQLLPVHDDVDTAIDLHRTAARGI